MFKMFIVGFIIYGLLHYYLGLRLFQSLEICGGWRWAVLSVFGLSAISLFFYFFLLNKQGAFANVAYGLMTYHLPVLLYGFLFVLSVDLLRLLLHLTHFKPEFLFATPQKTKAVLFGVFAIVCAVLLIVGYFNATHPQIKEYEIKVDKNLNHNGSEDLKIILLSDIHLNPNKSQAYLGRAIELVNAQQPDLIVIAGDLFDGNKAAVYEQQIGTELRQLNSRLGVFACLGNHDLMSKSEEEHSRGLDYLRSLNINLLIDSVAEPCKGISLVGRNDRMAKNRASIEELSQNLPAENLKILLDHQPYHLEQAQNEHFDIQFSGHTHSGQLFPLNFITDAIYECHHGYIQKGSTHFFISSGTGLWGPPFRIGSRSEIVMVKVKEKQ